MKKYILFALLFVGGVGGGLLWFKPWAKEKTQVEGYTDLKTLQNSGVIRVGILQNATDYYVDNGRIQGFQFEMVELMAKQLGMMPHYRVYASDWDYFYALLHNEVDVLAMNLSMTLAGKSFFCYTSPHSFSEMLPQSWVVHQGNKSLCHAIDEWMQHFIHTTTYKQLQTEYFSNSSKNRQRIGKQQGINSSGKISVYDSLIKKYAKKKGLDWRFVAAIIFQESKFNPQAKGKGGAYGLMQMTPITAQHYGIQLDSSAEKQIAYGCMHIEQIVEKYSGNYAKEDDLLKVTLLAYNTGSGYVDAVRKLTKEKGIDPDNWHGMEYVLRYASNKSLRKNKFNSKGKKGLKYVDAVWMRYLHYKNIVSDEN